jgi:hypothetical protein
MLLRNLDLDTLGTLVTTHCMSLMAVFGFVLAAFVWLGERKRDEA